MARVGQRPVSNLTERQPDTDGHEEAYLPVFSVWATASAAALAALAGGITNAIAA